MYTYNVIIQCVITDKVMILDVMSFLGAVKSKLSTSIEIGIMCKDLYRL